MIDTETMALNNKYKLLKKSVDQKTTFKNINRKSSVLEKIFVKHKSEKELGSKIYNTLLQLNNKMISNPIKMSKTLEQKLHKGRSKYDKIHIVGWGEE